MHCFDWLIFHYVSCLSYSSWTLHRLLNSGSLPDFVLVPLLSVLTQKFSQGSKLGKSSRVHFSCFSSLKDDWPSLLDANVLKTISYILSGFFCCCCSCFRWDYKSASAYSFLVGSRSLAFFKNKLVLWYKIVCGCIRNNFDEYSCQKLLIAYI